MSGLLRGCIGCLNSQEWCSRLRALYLCPLFHFVLPPLLCSCSATAVKGFREDVFSRKVVFHLMLPLCRLIHTETHTHTYTFKHTKKLAVWEEVPFIWLRPAHSCAVIGLNCRGISHDALSSSVSLFLL